jgi:hypothetical protein
MLRRVAKRADDAHRSTGPFDGGFARAQRLRVGRLAAQQRTDVLHLAGPVDVLWQRARFSEKPQVCVASDHDAGELPAQASRHLGRRNHLDAELLREVADVPGNERRARTQCNLHEHAVALVR